MNMSYDIEKMEDVERVVRLAVDNNCQVELTCLELGTILVSPGILKVSPSGINISGEIRREISFDDLTDYQVK